MSPRQIVVVDVETNGLDVERHQVVEVAWWNLTTNERGCYIPKHDVSVVLAAADIKALQVNRYIDRIAMAPQPDFTDERWRLHSTLTDNTCAGSNPAFDTAMLAKHFRACGCTPEPWHHRKLDLAAYAAGVLGLDPGDLLGLAKVCALLGVETGDHTAEGDVTATGRCFQALFERAGVAARSSS